MHYRSELCHFAFNASEYHFFDFDLVHEKKRTKQIIEMINKKKRKMYKKLKKIKQIVNE